MSRQRAVRERWLKLPASNGDTLAIRVVDVARSRYLRLTLDREGPRLSKPGWVSLREATAFAEEKRGWLEAQLAARTRHIELVELPALVDGACGRVPLRGESIPLRIEDGPRPALTGHADGLLLRLPPGEETRRRRLCAGLFRSFYDSQLRADCAPMLARHTRHLGRAPVRLRLRPLRSLWGSLSADDHLSLDLALILAPPDLLEYVLVHELCHLFERNHGPLFWAKVASVLPDYRQRQRRLRAQGAALKTALAMLVDA